MLISICVKRLSVASASGIVFVKTKDLGDLIEFYVEQIGATVWLDQGDCAILKHGNMLFGFCERESVETSPMLTFFYPTVAEVDDIYRKLKGRAMGLPKQNTKYEIYQFFAEDPDGRLLEFQAFLHAVLPHMDGESLLRERRSVRQFTDQVIPEHVIEQMFDLCRMSPTSRNSQSYYYVVVRNREVIESIATVRGSSSVPISRGRMAVAVCVDSEKTLRPEHDGCIAAYHLMLAAKLHGLGTCWIADMDRDEVKAALGLPLNHHVATVTPIGYAAETPSPKKHREVDEFVFYRD